MGASVIRVVASLTGEFGILVVLANIIAWPAAYRIVSLWLENFAYRIEIGLSVFLLSAILTGVVAMLTVASLSFKAARANPVETLRYE
jgi:putative ABC transport system permease protein